MSKILRQALAFFSLAMSLCFSTPVDWGPLPLDPQEMESLLVDGTLDLSLNQRQHLTFTIPESYKLDYSANSPGGSFFIMEFVPEWETVDNWTSLISLTILPRPVNFQQFVEECTGPIVPFSIGDNFLFAQMRTIPTFSRTWFSPAVRFPEFEPIEGLDEFTGKIGYLGDNYLYIFAICFRFDPEIPSTQRERKLDYHFGQLCQSAEMHGHPPKAPKPKNKKKQPKGKKRR